MSLPSLSLLRGAGLPIVVCARPWARDLLAGLLEGGDFIAMQGSFLRDRAQVRAHVRARLAAHPRTSGSWGLTLPDSLSSAAVFRLAGLPVAGYRDDGRSLLLRWPIDKPAAVPHAVVSWYHLTREALGRWNLPTGPEDPGARLGLAPTAAQQAQAADALQAAGLVDRPFVLIAPTATGLHRGRDKVWPGFAELTRHLVDQGIAVAMCPPPAETDAARANAPQAQLLAPMGLGAFAALTRLATLVVCNDSGVSHVAAAADARQITLFGVTQRQRTAPWSERALCLGVEGQWPAVEEVMKVLVHQLAQTSAEPRAAALTGVAPA